MMNTFMETKPIKIGDLIRVATQFTSRAYSHSIKKVNGHLAIVKEVPSWRYGYYRICLIASGEDALVTHGTITLHDRS